MGWIEAERGELAAPDLTIAGPPRAVLGALIVGDDGSTEVEIAGEREAFEALRTMVVLPERLREEAQAALGAEGATATARTA